MVGVDARGHSTQGRAPRGTRSLSLTHPCGMGREARGNPVRIPTTQHEHPQVAMKGGMVGQGGGGEGAWQRTTKGGDHSVKRIQEGRWVCGLGGGEMGECV